MLGHDKKENTLCTSPEIELLITLQTLINN